MAQTINVNTTPGQFMPTLYYSQGDIGREFEIVLASSDGWSIPSGATVTMVATKPSGFGFSVAGTLTDNVASFTTTETMTNEHGRYPAEIRITSGTDVIGTANFYLSGERDPHPEETIDGDAEEIIPELTLLVERVEAAASSVLDMTVVANTLPAGSDATYSYDEETNTATFGIPKGADGSLASGVLAPTYSSSSTYAVGDYVYYSGNLYRCTTAITTAEAWTSGHWTQVALAPEVTDVKSEITPVYPSSLMLDKSNYKMTDIKSVKKKITSTATWQTDTYIIFQNIAIEENQELLVHFDGRSIDGASSTNLAAYMFYDVDGTQIGSNRYIKYSDIDSVSGACDFHDIAPTGSKKVSVTIYGISSVAPTIGNTCYINNACLFIGVVGFKSTNMIYNKLNLNMDWVHGGIWSGNVVNVRYRICTKNIVNVPIDFVIDIKSGYRYGVIRYNNNGVQISDTGWLTTKHSIYAGERVHISIAKVSESTTEWADFDTFINAITFYPVANVNDSPQYYYYGEKIETKKHAIAVSDLGVTRVDPADTSLVAQGGAVYGGKLFQVYKENYMQIYDIATNTLESSFAITCGHGDCVSFSNEFYDVGDTYPLIYITSDETPSSVYVNRINNGSATLIRKLVFPQSAGYYGGHALDADNNIIYLISYSEQDYRTASNNNHMIVTAWDLSSLTDNGDSTYTPQLLDTFELPFIYVCQDQEFYNGRIYVLSSFLASEAPSKVVIINPYAHTISNTITNLPTSITNTEDEVITFMQDNSGVWHMVIGKHTAYHKLSFA